MRQPSLLTTCLLNIWVDFTEYPLNTNVQRGKHTNIQTQIDNMIDTKIQKRYSSISTSSYYWLRKHRKKDIRYCIIIITWKIHWYVDRWSISIKRKRKKMFFFFMSSVVQEEFNPPPPPLLVVLPLKKSFFVCVSSPYLFLSGGMEYYRISWRAVLSQ